MVFEWVEEVGGGATTREHDAADTRFLIAVTGY